MSAREGERDPKDNRGFHIKSFATAEWHAATSRKEACRASLAILRDDFPAIEPTRRRESRIGSRPGWPFSTLKTRRENVLPTTARGRFISPSMGYGFPGAVDGKRLTGQSGRRSHRQAGPFVDRREKSHGNIAIVDDMYVGLGVGSVVWMVQYSVMHCGT